MKASHAPERAKAAYVTVGGGRGFVVATATDRYIVTAAHCLPALPEAFPGGHDDRYQHLIGPLDGATTVSASCLFADPVADILRSSVARMGSGFSKRPTRGIHSSRRVSH